MEKDIYLQQIDYFKGARVLHHFEFNEPQEFNDDYFNTHHIHALVICDYAGEQIMLFYLDDDLEIVQEFECMIAQQAKDQTSIDFKGVDIQWHNR